MRRRWRVGCLATVIALFALVGSGLTFRCDRHPPEETFKRCFKAVPPGVSDIRAAGHISVGGADVWMRFKADESALATITRDYTPLSTQETREIIDYLLEETGIAYPPAARRTAGEGSRIHWEGLKRITHPVAYAKTGEVGGSTSRLVIDAPRRLVYYYHWNQ